MNDNLFDEFDKAPRLRDLVPYVAGSETSQAAAGSMLPSVGTVRRLVLDHLRAAGEFGCTDEELGDRFTEMKPSTARARRIELTAEGLVYDTGKLRKTRAGRMAVVWRASYG